MIFDDFGTWKSLGSVDVDFEWQLFPLFAETPNSTFRIAYSLNKPAFVRIFPKIFLRSVLFTGGQYFFDQRWKTLYAKEDPEIFECPYPPDLIKTPLIPRQLEIKFSDRNLTVLNRYGLALNVEIFEKISTNVNYPSQSTIEIADILSLLSESSSSP